MTSIPPPQDQFVFIHSIAPRRKPARKARTHNGRWYIIINVAAILFSVLFYAIVGPLIASTLDISLVDVYRAAISIAALIATAILAIHFLRPNRPT